jgi:hypothetical protein
MKHLLIGLLISFNLNAKTITQDGQEYSCSPKKSCQDELKAAKAEIKKLKKQLAEQKPVIQEKVVTEEKIVVQERVVVKKAKENLNIVQVGLRQDTVHTGVSVSSNSATVTEYKDLVADITYYRRKVTSDGIGLGIGIDANGVIRGVFGVEW